MTLPDLLFHRKGGCPPEVTGKELGSFAGFPGRFAPPDIYQIAERTGDGGKDAVRAGLALVWRKERLRAGARTAPCDRTKKYPEGITEIGSHLINRSRWRGERF